MGIGVSALTAIMDELGTVLESALGDDVNQVVPRRWFNPTPPSVDIYPADPFRTEDAAGYGQVSGAYQFVVRARVNTADNEAGQDVLLAMMDDENTLCVAAALEDDQTLNGLASTVYVTGPSGFRLYDDTGAQALLGVEWLVVVLNVTT